MNDDVCQCMTRRSSCSANEELYRVGLKAKYIEISCVSICAVQPIRPKQAQSRDVKKKKKKKKEAVRSFQSCMAF